MSYHYPNNNGQRAPTPVLEYGGAGERSTTPYAADIRSTTPNPAGAFHSASAAAFQTSSSSAGFQSGSLGTFNSHLEQSIINATQPINVHETAQITVGRYHGVHVNKAECDSFTGPCLLNRYTIHDDPNPEVIHKRLERGKTVQEVSVKYLNPPPAPKPGDLILRERATFCPPAPPVILRIEAPPAPNPEPVVCRERPPNPPAPIPEQVIEIDGPANPPPPRRLIIEKLPSVPKPPPILIEKWLPYKPQPRRVVYQRSHSVPTRPPPRNLIIEWELGNAQVEQVCHDLGVQEMDPQEYIRRYGYELKTHCEIPNLCKHLNKHAAPETGPELIGDLSALKLVDLEAHGLGKYRKFVH